MARTQTPTPDQHVVLLVRHGQTPTTGKVLPGRPPGCTSPTPDAPRPSAAPQRIAELKQVDAVYASPLERARETAAPIARGARS